MASGNPKIIWGCPFYRRFPERYLACRDKELSSIHRVKEHIYRSHKPQPFCYRCHKQFGSERLVKEHLKDPVPCQVATFPEPDGIDKEVEKELRGKKRTKDRSDIEKWKDMYRILFPDVPEDQIPLPYTDQSVVNVAHYTRQINQDMERQQISTQFQGEDPQVIDSFVTLPTEERFRAWRTYQEQQQQQQQQYILAQPPTSSGPLPQAFALAPPPTDYGQPAVDTQGMQMIPYSNIPYEYFSQDNVNDEAWP